jgi:hypothetical protein
MRRPGGDGGCRGAADLNPGMETFGIGLGLQLAPKDIPALPVLAQGFGTLACGSVEPHEQPVRRFACRLELQQLARRGDRRFARLLLRMDVEGGDRELVQARALDPDPVFETLVPDAMSVEQGPR